MKELLKYKILIVDDKRENLISLAGVLKNEGYQCDTAISGTEALKLLLKNEYGLIILDVQMPEMNGFEVAELIKGSSKTKDIPLIFLSANAVNENYFQKGHEVGALDYLVKPVDINLLRLKVRNFIQLHHSAIELGKVNAILAKKALDAKTSYENLYYSLPQDIFIINKQGIVVNINRTEKLCCGLSSKDILHKDYNSLPYLGTIMDELISPGTFQDLFKHHKVKKNIEFTFTKANQSKMYGEAIVSNTIIEDKPHIQISILDVTAKKEAEKIHALNLKEISSSEKLTNAILRGASINEISNILLHTLYEIANIKSSRIHLFNKDQNKLVLTGENTDTELIQQLEEKIGIKIVLTTPSLNDGSIFRKIFQRKKGMITSNELEIKNILNELLPSNFLEKAGPQTKKIPGINTFGILPLTENDSILGVITFSTTAILKEEEKQTIIRFSQHIATLLSKKKYEIDLAESEAFSRGVLSSLSSHIAVVDKNGFIVSTNESWKIKASQPKTNPLIKAKEGSNYFEIFENEISKGGKDAITALKSYRGLLSILQNDEDRFEMEYNYQLGSNKEWFILSITNFNKDHQKAVVRHINISERKKSETELNENRNLINNVYEASPDAVIIINEKGIITKWNIKSEELFGWKEEEVLGKKLSENLLPKRYIASFNPLLQEYLVNGKELELNHAIETTSLNKEGKEIYVSLNIAISTIMGKKHFIGFIRDISQRKKAEMLLFNSQRRYKNLLGNMNDGFMVSDLEGKITFANEQLRKIFGIKQTEVPEFKKNNFISEKYRKIIQERLRKRAAGEILSDNFEFKGLNKNGNEIWLEVRVSPIQEKGIIVGTQSVIRDITARKETEKSLMESEKKIRNFANHLNQVLEDERTNLAREIHDELGQQLAGIKFGISSFKRLANNNEEIRLKIKDLLNDVDETIQNLRKIATELRPGILDTLGLGASITWLVKEFEKKNKISCQLESNIGERNFGKEISTCFFRICQESLTNISKHAAASKINIRLMVNENKLTLSIKDNGKGIQLTKQNNPFSMGLIGMKERASIIGGEFEIISKKNKGTTIITAIEISN